MLIAIVEVIDAILLIKLKHCFLTSVKFQNWCHKMFGVACTQVHFNVFDICVNDYNG